ncbi:TPA: Dam family site-specific DNA-(adenine-N6)-methyltransferase [Clostridioides difficile]|nr:Dam family site-specific DNA-(adenine-N6)-methyltransferase [Clostridioides difficile]HCQ6315743.1 Dam family site-specific DNA-(adenine-N6)-methyltransferase [Clostridioides difficile]
MQSKQEKTYIASPLNYTGGKAKLLPQIEPLFPQNISVFLDLFCGGCNVGINIAAEQTIYNDVNSNLIGLYKTFKRLKPETIVKKINEIIDYYGFSRTSEHSFAFYGGDNEKGVSVYNRDKYLRLRNDFNSLETKNNHYYIMLYCLILFGFNNQIRFNANGKFNLPVGKRDFNDVIREKLICFIDCIKTQNASFFCKDFEKVDISLLDNNSLVYVDPPYLISTATYNESDGWNENDELRLLNYLDYLNANNIRFALSNILKHKGRTNKLLQEWLRKSDYKVFHLRKDYSNSNYQVKEKETKTDEILVINY